MTIHHLTKDASSTEVEQAVVEIGRDHTTVELLGAVRTLEVDAVTLLATVVRRLESRQRDISELLNISKSLTELTRKVDRLASRIGADIADGEEGE